jgi:hypothetical protein
MMKLPSFISGYLVKRLAAGATGGLAVLFGQDIAGSLAELLTDPKFVEQVFNWIGGGLMIYAAIARKDVTPAKQTLDSVEQTITEYLPKEMDIDPYPGWDYDPVNGWVRVDEPAQ